MKSYKVDESEKYGRYLADVVLEGNRRYADMVISSGNGVEYFGGKR
jgi:endonuclease YncB( thermonuclease family)